MPQDETTNQAVTEINAGYVADSMARIAQKESMKGADRVSMAKDYIKWFEGGSALHPSVVERKQKLTNQFQQVMDQLSKITGGAV